MKRFSWLMVLVLALVAGDAFAFTLGEGWENAGMTVTKPSGKYFYVQKYAKAGGGLLSGAPSVASLLNAYASGTTSTTTKNYTQTNPNDATDFYMDLGYSDNGSASGTGATPLFRWFATDDGDPASEPYVANGPNSWLPQDGTGPELDDSGDPVQFTHEIDLVGPTVESGHYAYDYLVTMTWTTGPNVGQVFYQQHHVIQAATPASTVHIERTEDYDFDIEAPYSIQNPDSDNDGDPDATDPWPDDPDNNGWGDAAHDDADGDGVENWDDEYPYDATRGVEGSSSGEGGTSETGQPSDLPFTKTVWLDNTDLNQTAEFRVVVLAADNGAILSDERVMVGAGSKMPVTIGADEAFTVDVWRYYYVDGNLVEEHVTQGEASDTNAQGTASGGAVQTKTSSPQTETSEPATAPAASSTELEALNKIQDKLTDVQNEVRAAKDSAHGDANQTNSLLDKMLNGSENTSGTGTASSAIGEVITKWGTLKNSLSGIVSDLGMGSADQTDFSWSMNVGGFIGGITLDFEEQYGQWLNVIRGVLLLVLSIWFVRELVDSVTGQKA